MLALFLAVYILAHLLSTASEISFSIHFIFLRMSSINATNILLFTRPWLLSF